MAKQQKIDGGDDLAAMHEQAGEPIVQVAFVDGGEIGGGHDHGRPGDLELRIQTANPRAVPLQRDEL